MRIILRCHKGQTLASHGPAVQSNQDEVATPHIEYIPQDKQLWRLYSEDLLDKP